MKRKVFQFLLDALCVCNTSWRWLIGYRYIILSCPELPLTFAYPTPEFPTPNFEYHTAFDGVVF
ncbi:hypothetical protein PVK06_007600 [Gossypium arboreum]|uniref:Uncharacterized protein n=1 Tax=Gossypium arboreum TaxID=29729 RepID=A0ABR0QHQ8_GOSAR|nr:hypothetical protein PVK06_007600 [Gossypium arboreum]